jgi:hypothetical protein
MRLPRLVTALFLTAACVALAATPGNAASSCFGEAPTLTGSAGADTLTGSAGNDVIVGRGGDDDIFGGGGVDRICAGPGNDTVAAGSGADFVDGGDGNDTLRGWGGRDLLRGGSGDDDISGGPDPDVARGGPGSDSCDAETTTGCEGAIVADHRATDLSVIPDSWRDRAAREVVWAYGSTSHGTQVWTGAHYLDDLLGLSAFSFAKDWHDVPSQTTPARLRMAYDSGWSWDAAAFYDTAADLLADAPQANAFMWSWCGELSWDTTAVDAYLAAMARLEADYPSVTFVYMTGHTDGPDDQVLEGNNQAIRDYAAAHAKVLYDFADIESWDPAGTHYPNTDDSCPWCGDWCASHPQDCPDLVGECAHSHPFNCILKGRALWWLSARLGGWAGE